MRHELNPTKIVCDVDNKINEDTNLISDRDSFLKSSGKDFSDIDLVVNGHTIKAHKCISNFRSSMPKKLKISIGDTLPSVEAFQTLLRYIYCGKTEFPPQDALYLLQASNFYGFSNNRLRSFCIYTLEHNITYDNVWETFEASIYTKHFDIKTHALKLRAQGIAFL